jgi:hypothetical protein
MVYAATRWVFWIRITRHIRHWDSHGPSGAVLPGLVVLLEHTYNEDVQRCIHDIHDIHDIHVEFVMDIPPDITWISWTVSFSRMLRPSSHFLSPGLCWAYDKSTSLANTLQDLDLSVLSEQFLYLKSTENPNDDTKTTVFDPIVFCQSRSKMIQVGPW